MALIKFIFTIKTGIKGMLRISIAKLILNNYTWKSAKLHSYFKYPDVGAYHW